MSLQKFVIEKLNNKNIKIREDGYVFATKLCEAGGKSWAHYKENKNSVEFIDKLSRSIGIPINLLIQTIMTGKNENRGTWIHPKIAIIITKKRTSYKPHNFIFCQLAR